MSTSDLAEQVSRFILRLVSGMSPDLDSSLPRCEPLFQLQEPHDQCHSEDTEPGCDVHDEIRWTKLKPLQLRCRLHDQIFILGKLIVIVQALWIRKSSRWFDNLSTYNLFDW